MIINWGNSNENNFPRTLNDSLDILGASNKLTAFMVMRDAGVQIPEFWTNREDIPDDAFPIVCRTILNGHSGAGIVIANNRGEIVNAPLYVKYMKKRDEYRCQSCGFHLQVNGRYIIECHHTRPVAQSGVREVHIDELVSLCPTCHRIAHTKLDPYTVQELRALLKRAA
jgi:hypothetical protein